MFSDLAISGPVAKELAYTLDLNRLSQYYSTVSDEGLLASITRFLTRLVKQRELIPYLRQHNLYTVPYLKLKEYSTLLATFLAAHSVTSTVMAMGALIHPSMPEPPTRFLDALVAQENADSRSLLEELICLCSFLVYDHNEFNIINQYLLLFVIVFNESGDLKEDFQVRLLSMSSRTSALAPSRPSPTGPASATSSLLWRCSARMSTCRR